MTCLISQVIIMKLPVVLLSRTALSPTRGSSGAAGYDLYASRRTVIKAGSLGIVNTDLAMAIPEGCVGLVRPRSGLAMKKNIDTRAGVIDSDYRGEVMVALRNESDLDFVVEEGDRIAQLLVVPVALPEVFVTDKLDDTVRGVSGFGSTGK